MRKPVFVIIALALLAMLAVPALAADTAALDAAVNGAAAYVLKTVKAPRVDAVGGEWAVLGLARSGYDVPDAYYEAYYATVEKYVKERGGVLHDLKYTEYSRLMLGLTAAGYDPRDVAGYDLSAPLADFDKTVWQGVNGPVCALLALDSLDYANSRRDDYVAEILRRQLTEGGWSLTGGLPGAAKNQAGDPDISGMALQALAKYQSKPEVKAATDKALAFLSKTQTANGGYSGWGSENIESSTQVLVALCELGISPDDSRFAKNGHTLVDNILSFQNADGSFKHMRNGSGNSQLSTEQALYALVAAQRAQNGKNSLYRMADAPKRGASAALPAGTGLPGKHPDVTALPPINPGKTFPDIAGHPRRAAIEALAARGIIGGKNERSFDPQAPMTRAEFAAVITRGLGLPKQLRSVTFNDVQPRDWFFDNVSTAYNYGIVEGTGKNLFKPGGTVTRQEAAVMVVRAARLCGLETARADAEIRDTLAQFGDYRTVAGWAQSSLAFCFSTGILDDDALAIKPPEAVKRGEIAEMICRMLEKANLL